MGVGSKDSVPAGFPKKDSGLAPEGLSIRTGTGAGHPPLWCPTMALKIKIPGGPRGSPGLLFPPFLCVKKGVRRPDPFLQGVLEFVRTYKNVVLMKRDIQCAATSFLHAEKGRKETPGALPLVPPGNRPVFSPMKTGGRGPPEPTPYREGPGAPGSLGASFYRFMTDKNCGIAALTQFAAGSWILSVINPCHPPRRHIG